MTDIVVGKSIVDAATAESPTRGSTKMQVIREKIAASIPTGHQIVDWKRNDSGDLVAVTAPIPEE